MILQQRGRNDLRMEGLTDAGGGQDDIGHRCSIFLQKVWTASAKNPQTGKEYGGTDQCKPEKVHCGRNAERIRVEQHMPCIVDENAERLEADEHLQSRTKYTGR